MEAPSPKLINFFKLERHTWQTCKKFSFFLQKICGKTCKSLKDQEEKKSILESLSSAPPRPWSFSVRVRFRFHRFYGNTLSGYRRTRMANPIIDLSSLKLLVPIISHSNGKALNVPQCLFRMTCCHFCLKKTTITVLNQL